MVLNPPPRQTSKCTFSLSIVSTWTSCNVKISEAERQVDFPRSQAKWDLGLKYLSFRINKMSTSPIHFVSKCCHTISLQLTIILQRAVVRTFWHRRLHCMWVMCKNGHELEKQQIALVRGSRLIMNYRPPQTPGKPNQFLKKEPKCGSFFWFMLGGRVACLPLSHCPCHLPTQIVIWDWHIQEET